MSRCFPFPPPGYEPRPRSEHEDLLKKEKHKEKKQINEKNDKKKGERKEKDRDRRKDKQNKKHKREKSREERKNKRKDKHSHQTLELQNHKNADVNNIRPEERGQNEAVKDIKPTVEMVTQLPGQEGHASQKGSSTCELLPQSTNGFGPAGFKEESDSLRRMFRKSGQATQHNYGMVQKNGSIAYTNKKGMDGGVGSKTRIKNGKSLQVGSAEKHSNRRHNSKGMDLPQDSSCTQRGSEGVHATSRVISGARRGPNGRIIRSPNTTQGAEEVEQYPEISVHSAYGKTDRIRTKGMTRKENQSSNNCRGNIDEQLLQSKYIAVEVKAKTNYHKGVKGKDRDKNVSKGKIKDKNKVKELEGNGNANEQKHEDLDALDASKNKVDGLAHSICLDEKNLSSDDIKKRKDMDTNSSVHEHSMRTTKLPRMSPANLTHANGKISPHTQGITPYSSSELVGRDNSEVDQNKPLDEYCTEITGSDYLHEHKVSVYLSGYESNKGNLKQPHPDTKYLSQVHSIPATEEFPEYIDQDWLFSKNHITQKTVSFDSAESRQVWSDVQMIDTANVIALPYVVPL